MKEIIIFLLVIVISILGYNQYQKYQRFHPNNVDYVAQNSIDNSYYDPKVVMSYYEAIEILNGYVISQWSTDRIDVRNPKKDNVATRYAINEYQKKLGQVKYYEAILKQSTAYKAKGLTNEEIRSLEKNQFTEQSLSDYKNDREFYGLFEKALSIKPLKIGNKGPWVYELQKYLASEGYTITIDGIFRKETHTALKDFEYKNELYPDGILDLLTLKKLFKPSTSMSKTLLVTQ